MSAIKNELGILRGRRTEIASPDARSAGDACRIVPPQQGSGSVNEALARGLRTRIVKDVAAAEAAMMRLSQSSARINCAPATAELRDVALMGVVLGIVMAHQAGTHMDSPEQGSFPLMLPTPSGAILGDAILGAPYVCMNTFIGGRRALTPSKERLRTALAEELSTVTTAHMETILRGYFVGMLSKQSAGRLEVIRDQSLNDCFALMRRISVILDRYRCSLLSKEEREDGIARNDLYWKWATLQHQAQQVPA